MDRNQREIVYPVFLAVALRKESVDRNLIGRALARLYSSSLSARRAWIEIKYPGLTHLLEKGRSPQGERG